MTKPHAYICIIFIHTYIKGQKSQLPQACYFQTVYKTHPNLKIKPQNMPLEYIELVSCTQLAAF